jgi:hypothetical protein
MKRTRLLALALLLALAAAASYCKEEWRVEGCLDHGGGWNYQTRTCESEDDQ